MKKFIWIYILLGIAAGTLLLSHCGTRTPPKVTYFAAQAPGNIHVSNGQAIGFYSTSGVEKSVISLGINFGTTQPFAQNSVTGMFYFGSNDSTAKNNYVLYLSGINGTYAFASLDSSTMKLVSGTTSGLAVYPQANLVYVADSTNDVVIFLNALTLNYGIGGDISNSTFAAPEISNVSLGATSLNVVNNVLVVSENQVGSAYFMNATKGNSITAAGANLNLPLVSSSTGCNAPGLVSQVQVNPGANTAYVLCGSSMIYLSLFTPIPNYLFTSLNNSTFGTGISNITDMVYDAGDNRVVVAGGSSVAALDAKGNIAASVDLSSYHCGAGLNLGGVAYSQSAKQIYVTDTANSSVYVLDSATFNLATGVCGTSVFSTAGDVPHPTKIGYF